VIRDLEALIREKQMHKSELTSYQQSATELFLKNVLIIKKNIIEEIRKAAQEGNKSLSIGMWSVDYSEDFIPNTSHRERKEMKLSPKQHEDATKYIKNILEEFDYEVSIRSSSWVVKW
jgi:hypothetical protein